VSVRTGAEPYAHDGDDVAILLSHGFTSTPASLRPWAEALAGAGHTVRVPRLPGHGTTWRDMNRTTWADWYGALDAAFGELRARSRIVVVGGLSMGGALALRLAQRHGADEGTGVDGVVVVNPAVKLDQRGLWALPVGRWLLPSTAPVGNDIRKPGVVEDAYDRTPTHAAHSMVRGMRTVVRDLSTVTQPVLVLRSAADHVVPAASSALVLERVSSPDTEEVVLAQSYHVATLDHDAPVIHERSLSFVNRIARAHVGGLR
jgi:carboxylesterase